MARIATYEQDAPTEFDESRIRTAAAEIAQDLAGGANGFSWNYGEAKGKGYDPEGCFATVTEGRQSRWKDQVGKWRTYSACEDLHGAVWLRALDLLPVSRPNLPELSWCNRVEAGNKWQVGQNLLRLKKNLPEAWQHYSAGTAWDIGPGDAVQIQGRCVHTFVVLSVGLRDGQPVSLDHADYGQLHQPEGASRPDHSCRCYRGAAVSRMDGCWCVNGKRIIGRASVWDVAQRVLVATSAR